MEELKPQTLLQIFELYFKLKTNRLNSLELTLPFENISAKYFLAVLKKILNTSNFQ